MTSKAPWWERLNSALIPRIGPPPLGPYNQPPEVHTKPCPVCGQPMAGHTFEHRGNKPTLMHCPALER
jgi:hypothetical protein